MKLRKAYTTISYNTIQGAESSTFSTNKMRTLPEAGTPKSDYTNKNIFYYKESEKEWQREGSQVFQTENKG